MTPLKRRLITTVWCMNLWLSYLCLSGKEVIYITAMWRLCTHFALGQQVWMITTAENTSLIHFALTKQYTTVCQANLIGNFDCLSWVASTCKQRGELRSLGLLTCQELHIVINMRKIYCSSLHHKSTANLIVVRDILAFAFIAPLHNNPSATSLTFALKAFSFYVVMWSMAI